jgi:hypothetical protein
MYTDTDNNSKYNNEHHNQLFFATNQENDPVKYSREIYRPEDFENNYWCKNALISSTGEHLWTIDVVFLKKSLFENVKISRNLNPILNIRSNIEFEYESKSCSIVVHPPFDKSSKQSYCWINIIGCNMVLISKNETNITLVQFTKTQSEYAF